MRSSRIECSASDFLRSNIYEDSASLGLCGTPFKGLIVRTNLMERQKDAPPTERDTVIDIAHEARPVEYAGPW